MQSAERFTWKHSLNSIQRHFVFTNVSYCTSLYSTKPTNWIKSRKQSRNNKSNTKKLQMVHSLQFDSHNVLRIAREKMWLTNNQNNWLYQLISTILNDSLISALVINHTKLYTIEVRSIRLLKLKETTMVTTYSKLSTHDTGRCQRQSRWNGNEMT